MSPDVLDTLIARDLPAAQRGDTAAYGRLVAATQRMVASIALAITRDLGASEDIAQETFLAAWEKRRQLSNPQAFLPWLREVARNRAIDHVRAARHRGPPLDPTDALARRAAEPGPGPVDRLEDEERAQLLAQALDALPADSRDVLLLYYREGERTRDVAALLGLGEPAVRKRLQRGREALHAEVLRRLGAVARESAPGVAFTVTLAAGLAAAGPGSALAATGAGTGAKAAGGGLKAVLAALGAVAAAISLVLAAVWLEMRVHLRAARSERERRALVHNGLVYAALMATYIGVLAWASRAGWSSAAVLGTGAGFAVAIVLLALERRRHRRSRPDPPAG